MKFRTSYSAIAVFIIGVAATWQVCRESAAAGDTTAVSASAAVLSISALEGDQASYVGTNKCKMCHMKQYKSWNTKKHAKAIDSLKPGNASEIKEKFGLDPAKDYTTDGSCLECHTVGFGKPGGYAVPDPADKKSVKNAKYTAGIGCETCHGPGDAYVEKHTEVMKSKSTYTSDEMHAAGMNKIDETTCTQCHNEKSPTVDKANFKFDYKQRLIDGVHEHFPLKQRKE